MDKSLTIEEKQLAATVYAQRLAYISLTGKEPKSHDTITSSGYLTCWNNALEAVGGPFTEEGAALLAVLTSKATFHGRHRWYHPDFPAFLLRILYINFIADVSFSELADWDSLKFDQHDTSDQGVQSWLEACLGNHDKEDYAFLETIFKGHKSHSSHLLTIAAAWANNKFNNSFCEISISLADKEEHINRADFVHRAFPLLLCGAAPYFRILYKQAKARLIIERKIYEKLFGIDPGAWSAAEYIFNYAEWERGSSWHYDFLAVKISDAVPIEFGWGWVCDHETGETVADSLNEHANALMSRILKLQDAMGWKLLYYPHFLDSLVKKLTITPKREMETSPARIRNTAKWLEANFSQYTQVDDLQYFWDLLQSEKVSVKNKKLPAVKKTIEWIGFRLALAKEGKLKQATEYPSPQDRRLLDDYHFQVDFANDFPSYRHAHLYSFFCDLPPAQADAALNDMITKGGMWSPAVKSAFKIPLNPANEADRAYLLADELASISLLRLRINELSPAEKEDAIAAEWEKYWLTNELNAPENIEKRTSFLTEHEQLADYFGRQIPYHKCFPAWWTETIQATPTYSLEATLNREIVRLGSLFTNHWKALFSPKDIQYLILILTEAAECETGISAQRLSAAIAWLNSYEQRISTVRDPQLALISPGESFTTQHNTSIPPNLFDKLCGGLKPEQLTRVIGQEGLGLYDASRKSPTSTATSTNWALLYWGLQYKGFLPAGLSAGKASELLKSTFGAAISKTRINDIKPDFEEKPRGYLARVLEILGML